MEQRPRFGDLAKHLCLLLALGASTHAVAKPNCSTIADAHLTVFANTWMETETATDTIVNPCTGDEAVASIDFKPGAGFVQMFPGGDLQAEVESVDLVRCADGRARVTRRANEVPLCDDLR